MDIDNIFNEARQGCPDEDKYIQNILEKLKNFLCSESCPHPYMEGPHCNSCSEKELYNEIAKILWEWKDLKEAADIEDNINFVPESSVWESI